MCSTFFQGTTFFCVKRQLVSTIDSDAQFVKNEWRATCNVIQCVGKLQTHIFLLENSITEIDAKIRTLYITAPICEIL